MLCPPRSSSHHLSRISSLLRLYESYNHETLHDPQPNQDLTTIIRRYRTQLCNCPLAQAPPPHSTASLHPPDPTFWNVVERVVEHLVHGVTALAWLFSEIVRTAPQKVRSAGFFFFFQPKLSDFVVAGFGPHSR